MQWRLFVVFEKVHDSLLEMSKRCNLPVPRWLWSVYLSCIPRLTLIYLPEITLDRGFGLNFAGFVGKDERETVEQHTLATNPN